VSNTHWEFKIKKPWPIPTHVTMIILVIVSLVGGACIGFQHGYEFGKAPLPVPVVKYPKPVGEIPCITGAIQDSVVYQQDGRWAVGYGRLAAAYERPLWICNGESDDVIKDPGDLSRLKEYMRCYPCENILKDVDYYAKDVDYKNYMYRECYKYRELFNGDQTP
jgi:hypothetical protein